jgi:hypothetical protein
VPSLITIAAVLLALLPYAVLATCVFIVVRTGSTRGLRDFAEVVRAIMRRGAPPG